MIIKCAHYSLLSYNTFGIDVKADLFYEYSSVGELKAILSEAPVLSQPFLHIGAGSNLLFVADYKGIIFHSNIKGIEVTEETEDDVKIRVGAGVVWDDFVDYCVERGWSGAENLSLIPGEVGASAVQNIGAYGAEAQDLIDEVEAVEVESGKDCVFTNADCCFAYRQSIFKCQAKDKYFVTYVTYKLSKHAEYNLEYGNISAELERYETVNLLNIRKAIIAVREAKLPDPKVEGNAGSFFMNPMIPRSQYEALLRTFPDMPHYDVNEALVKIPAAWMIDRCGWKGQKMGNAGVHDKQALVIVNKGGATGEEIIKMSQAIRTSVKDKFGIDIHPEVNFIGG